MKTALLLGAVAIAGLPGWSETSQTPADGRELVASLGCGACHAGVPDGEAIRSVAPPLGEGTKELAPAYIFHYLADPQTVQPGIAPARMPSYALDERQRVALALFVANDREMRGVDDAFRAAMGRHPDADRAEGQALFDAMNCAGCHLHPEAVPRVASPDLSLTALRVREDWLAGYLADPVIIRPAGPRPGRGGGMPDFRLDPAELTAITGFLMDLGETTVASPADAPPPPWQPLVLSPFAMRKAETLLRDRWSCLGCHQLGDDGGRIGPRLDGIAHRLRPEYVRALIHDPAGLAAGTVMPASLEQPDRLDLVASYLLLRDAPWTGGDPVPGLPEPPPPDTAPGAATYQARCAPCHGIQGAGDGFNAPFLPVAPTSHNDSAAMSLRPDDTLYDGIHAGGWILGKSHRMPAFGASLNDREERDLVRYMRTLCRCQGPAWSRDGRNAR